MYCSVSYLHPPRDLMRTQGRRRSTAASRSASRSELADERERRERAAAAADEEFSAGFLRAPRACSS